MKYSLILLVQPLKDQIICVENYSTLEEAQQNLERLAVDYIRQHQGTDQATQCLRPESDPNKVLNDLSFPHGMFLIKGENKYHLYDKKIKLESTWLMSTSQSVSLESLGYFSILEVDLKVPIPVPPPPPPFKGDLAIKAVYLDELIQKLEMENFGLKKVPLPVLEDDDISSSSEEEDPEEVFD